MKNILIVTLLTLGLFFLNMINEALVAGLPAIICFLLANRLFYSYTIVLKTVIKKTKKNDYPSAIPRKTSNTNRKIQRK